MEEGGRYENLSLTFKFYFVIYTPWPCLERDLLGDRKQINAVEPNRYCYQKFAITNLNKIFVDSYRKAKKITNKNISDPYIWRISNGATSVSFTMDTSKTVFTGKFG